MKRYVIGVAVAIVFVAYSLVLRHQKLGPVIVNSSSNPSTSLNTSSSSASNPPSTSTTYNDGTFTGDSENAFYGNVQVAAIISGGKITAVNFLQSPNENPNSIYINQQAIPALKQEAIKAQSPNVDIVTGATLTSQAFIQSLSNALTKAQS